MPDADQQIIRAKLEQDISRNASHIFRDREGHFSEDTLENRQLFIEIVMKPENYLGADKYGTRWYAEALTSGAQIWVQVRNDEIRNAVENSTPKTWHLETGLSAPM